MKKELGSNRLSKMDIIAYGFGGIATTLIATVKQQFSMKFMTDVAGVSAAAIGVVMMLITIFDAINDPLIGGVADRMNTRYGKYRPMMVAGVFMLGIAMIMQFTVPNFGQTSLIVYYAIAMTLYSVAFTATCIPWQALNSVMSDDSDQRNLLLASRQFLGFFAAGIVGVITLGLVSALGDGKQGWFWASVIYAAVSIASMCVAANGAKKKDYKDSIPMPAKMSSKLQLSTLLKNKALIVAGLVFGIYTMASWIVSTAQIYYFESVIGDISLVASTSFVMLIGNFLIVPLMPWLIRRVGKVGAIVVGMVLTLLRPIVVILTGSTSIPLIFTISCINAFGSVIANFAILSLIPDCTDYSEYHTGLAGAGLVNSAITFMQKFGGSFSTVIVGFALSSANYTAGAVVTDQVKSAIVNTMTWIPLVISVIAVLLLKFYPITTEYGIKMRKELAERRAAKADAPAQD